MKNQTALRKEMKRNDLKIGMVVEFRNGNKYLTYPSIESEGLILIRESGFIDLDNLDKDLKSIWESDFDIIKVFDARSDLDLAFYNWDSMMLLWERDEPTEVTMEEIAKLKGCKVENLKIIK